MWTHSFVVGVDEDDLVIFVNAVLIDPIRVQNSQVAASSPHSLLCSTPKPTLVLEVIDTLADGFAVRGT
jgi:hypothetical protein